MNKKVFQIFFLLVILSGFGYIINFYLKQKLSSIDDYSFVLQQAPNSEISRIDPIRINLARDIDLKKFDLNVPLKKEYIKFKPAIKGYAYFTDARTLEFQPNAPLPQGQTYFCTINFSKIFTDSKSAPFRFIFKTPVIGLNIMTEPPVYSDSAGSNRVEVNGMIKFNDFVEIPAMTSLLRATQGGKTLNISYLPDIENHFTKFVVKNISRHATPEPVKLVWKYKNTSGFIHDSLSIAVVPENSFEQVSQQLVYFPTPTLNVTFSEPIDSSPTVSNYLKFSKSKHYSIEINKNTLTIYFDSLNSQPDTLIISPGFKSIHGKILLHQLQIPFLLSESKADVQFLIRNSVLPATEFNNLLGLSVLNLSQIEVTVRFIPDANVLQFLQVNAVNGSAELNRVSKIVYSNRFNLSHDINYHPNTRVTYNLPLLGANFNDNGIYNFEISYLQNDIVNRQNINYTTANGNVSAAQQNYVFAPFNVIAKQTVTDSIFIFVHDLHSGNPIKNADIEVFDFQKNLKYSTITGAPGSAAFKSPEIPLFIKVTVNNRANYLKIANDQKINLKNDLTFGESFTKGVSSRVLNLHNDYHPGDSLKIPVIIKNRNPLLSSDKMIEIKLESPQGFFFSKNIVSQSLSGITLFRAKLNSDILPGIWYLRIKIGDIIFRYPFTVTLNPWNAPQNPMIDLEYASWQADSTEIAQIPEACPNIINTEPLKIKITEIPYYSADSIKIKINAPFSGITFFTIENGLHITKFWEDVSNTAEKEFILDRKKYFQPGAHISAYHFNTTESAHGTAYFSSEKSSNKSDLFTMLMPHDWNPEEPTQIQVINQTGATIQYFLGITTDSLAPLISNSLKNQFNLKQPYQLSTFDVNCNRNPTAVDAYTTRVPLLNASGIDPSDRFNFINLFGPFSIDANTNQLRSLSHSKLPDKIQLQLIGMDINTGEIYSVSKPAFVYQPIGLEMVLPEFAYAENRFSTQLTVFNNTQATDTFTLELTKTQNLDLIFPDRLFWIVSANDSVQIPIIGKINRSNESALATLKVGSSKNTLSERFQIPVYEPPVEKSTDVSGIILGNKSWQHTLIPLGIKGANNAQVQITNFPAPNLNYILNRLEKGPKNQLSSYLNYALPLLNIKKTVPNYITDDQIKVHINKAFEQLFIFQQRDGGFSDLKSADKSNLQLSCFAGWFMTYAAHEGFLINQGVYNRWLRYMQKEYQQFKYLKPHEIPPGYFTYTLAVAKITTVKELQQYVALLPQTGNEKLYFAAAFLELGKPKLSQNLFDTRKNLQISEYNLLELAFLLKASATVNVNTNPQLIVKTIIDAITKSSNTLNISYALFTLANYYLKYDETAIKLNYQINLGKIQPFTSNEKVEFIEIPIEYSLPKFIDIDNIGSDTLYVRVFNTGKTTAALKESTVNDLSINTVLTDMSNSPIQKNSCKIHDFLKYQISIKNSGKTKYDVLQITVPPMAGFNLLFAEGDMKQNIPLNANNEIVSQISLKSNETKLVTLYLKSYIKGNFTFFPVQINSNQFIYKTVYSAGFPITIN